MKRCHRETNISELPNEILAHILTKLPIEEAVRTSSLTKQWRHVYTEMPRLQFTEDSDQIHWKKGSDGSASNEWLSIVDRFVGFPCLKFLRHLKLLKLCVRGGLLKVQGLELIPPLQKVELIVCWQGGRSNEEDEYSVMKEFFKRENGVRRLSLVTRSITNSTIIEATFLNLTCVTIKMDFTELAAMEGFTRILRNAPKLQEISVKLEVVVHQNVPARRLRSTWQQDFWDKQGEPFQCLSKNVRIIDMHGIKFSCSHSMWFVMFLAKSARVLKKLELNVLRDTQMSPLIEEELHLVKPASTDLDFVLNLMDG
ncbi:putative F-box/LRR-repeat protein [Acorus calamus]|uniref:F-box/LRR-repeat protein n=1 Tax=Acorus calamus TaxID=4465 RepID=A0AAV9DHA4_ACOCL|nr:putative F-box/LRR-repeat protein [Acorus calamus]